MSGTIRVLCVCTHNQTRSVLTATLLQHHLATHGVDAVVTSAGTMAGGHAATDRTVRLLAERGLDASDHRSAAVTAETVAEADLILTAERAHVASIVGRWPAVFGRTLTLPEAVDLLRRAGPRAGATMQDWLSRTGADRRNALDYLDAADVGEIEDPTGQSPAIWSRVFAEIDELTTALAKAIS